MCRRPAGRRGVALLEALIALAIVATAAASLLAFASEALHAVHRGVRVDRESRAASAFLDAVSLWAPDELDQRLGARRQGPWTLMIERPQPGRYVVAIDDSTRSHQLLSTAFFRPSPGDRAR